MKKYLKTRVLKTNRVGRPDTHSNPCWKTLLETQYKRMLQILEKMPIEIKDKRNGLCKTRFQAKCYFQKCKMCSVDGDIWQNQKPTTLIEYEEVGSNQPEEKIELQLFLVAKIFDSNGQNEQTGSNQKEIVVQIGIFSSKKWKMCVGIDNKRMSKVCQLCRLQFLVTRIGINVTAVKPCQKRESGGIG